MTTLGRGWACSETAIKYGMPSFESVQEFSFPYPSYDGMCICCGLCSQRADCASFSYLAPWLRCELFDRVAGYDNFVPAQKSERQYFVLPGKSRHHQFCREDSDCVEEGDFCRGRVCTNLTGVSCRVISDHFRASDAYDRSSMDLYGWLDNKLVTLNCKMDTTFRGATRIMKIKKKLAFDDETLWSCDWCPGGQTDKYSVLNLVENIRMLRTEPTYELIVRCADLQINFAVNRSEPVIGTAPRPDAATVTFVRPRAGFSWRVSAPYVPSTHGNTLLSIADTDNPHTRRGDLARRDGFLSSSLGCTASINIFLRE